MNQISETHARYRPLLKKAAWRPNPDEMFNAPSLAKDTPGRHACEKLVSKGADLQPILDEFLLTARLEHLIAVGGSKARRFLFSAKCPLNAHQIAKLCRRMPPFIQAKLEDVYAGGKNIDSNPIGAFDTNGWTELRVRLPKFAHALAAYGQTKQIPQGALTTDKRARLDKLAREVTFVCNRLLEQIDSNHSVPSVAPAPVRPKLDPDWLNAVVKFAQATGVLRKNLP